MANRKTIRLVDPLNSNTPSRVVKHRVCHTRSDSDQFAAFFHPAMSNLVIGEIGEVTMIRSLEAYNRARFDFYNRRMAEFGLKCGLAMKSMEDSFRKELLDQLSSYTKTNTAIANLLSKHEKTVRNLKRRQRDDAEKITKQNRMFLIASLIHDATWEDSEKWLSDESILDAYYDQNPEDDTFDEDVLSDVLNMLVREGTLVERRLQYSVFYRTSERTIHRARVAENQDEAYEIIAAIAESFQTSADEVSNDPASLESTKFTEFTANVKNPEVVKEINEKLRAYARELIEGYEREALDVSHDETVKLKLVSLVTTEAEA